MVKIQDGSLVFGSQLLGGETEDSEGKKLKFEHINETTYQAKSEMSDGSGRVNIYSINMEDTQFRVSVATKTKEEIQAEQKALTKAEDIDYITKKSTGEVTITPKTEKAFKEVVAGKNKTAGSKK